MTRVLITGGNRGIGLELVKACQTRGWQVTAACRQASEALDSTGATVLDQVDVTDAASIKGLVDRLDDQPIDLLINNAGRLSPQSLGEIDDEAVEGILTQFRVNALGPLLVSQALYPRMATGGKIAIITSRMGSIADNSSGGSYGYRMSKAAVNAAGVSLAQDLRGEGIAVGLFHPGFVRTEMTSGQGNVEPSEAAADLLARIDELSLDTSGGFWHAKGDSLPW